MLDTYTVQIGKTNKRGFCQGLLQIDSRKMFRPLACLCLCASFRCGSAPAMPGMCLTLLIVKATPAGTSMSAWTRGRYETGSVSLTCLVTHDHLPRQARDRHDETLTERLFSQGDPCIAHEYSRCVNHPGGARCDCREGYVGQPLGPAGDGVNATVRFDNSVHSMISLLVGSRNSLVVTTLVLKKHHFVLPRHASKLGRPQRRSEQCVNVQLLGWLTGMHADSPAAG